MPLPKHAKDLKKHERFSFFKKCHKCDRKRKHTLFINSYSGQVFYEDDCDGHTYTDYFDEVSVICNACRVKHCECMLERFNDDILASIKKEAKESLKVIDKNG